MCKLFKLIKLMCSSFKPLGFVGHNGKLNRLIANSLFRDKIQLIENELGDVSDCIIKDLSGFGVIQAIEFIRTELKLIEIKIQVNYKLSFSNKAFDKELDLSNCIFNEEVIFRNCSFKEDTSFNNSKFKKPLNLAGSLFEKNLRFHNVEFNESCILKNTSFKNLVDFYSAKFCDIQQFYLTDFLGVTIFSNVTFCKEVQFLYNKVSSNSIISFESAKFKQSLDISRANFWCALNFWYVEITKIPELLSLYKNDNRPEGKGSSEEAWKKLRESYRIIKSTFSSAGNSIEALKFYSYEMAAYEKELQANKTKKRKCALHWIYKNNTKVSKYFKLKSEMILLRLNKFSNNFGTSWFRGVVFTLAVTNRY